MGRDAALCWAVNEKPAGTKSTLLSCFSKLCVCLRVCVCKRGWSHPSLHLCGKICTCSFTHVYASSTHRHCEEGLAETKAHED